MGLIPSSHPHSLGYACTLYAPTSPLLITRGFLGGSVGLAGVVCGWVVKSQVQLHDHVNFRQCPLVSLRGRKSRSPKAGHPKAGRSDFRNQRFEPDTGKMRKMRKGRSPQKNKGLRRFRGAKRRKTRKMRKMRTRKRGKCGKCG